MKFHLARCLLLSGIALGAGLVGECQRPADVFRQVRTSEDVLWLEAIAGGDTVADQLLAGTGYQPKNLRTLAYARLGALGTSEALAAVERIEAKARMVIPAPERVSLGRWSHPAEHFGDSFIKPLAQTTDHSGISYAIVISSILGDFDSFLIKSGNPEDSRSWTRPKLIPNRIYAGVREPTLSWGPPNYLVFRFLQEAPGPRASVMQVPLNPAVAPMLGPQEWSLSIADIERDSDGDGWTDIEERRLGLDPNNPDTDGDEIPDGKDICPNYAPAVMEANGEDAQILQKAFFAMFGLSRSRALLLVEGDSQRLQLWGYAGPVIYEADKKKWSNEHQFGAVFVKWRITQETDTEATVEITDYEGPLAAGGYVISLRKIGGQGFVIDTTRRWVS